MTHEDLVSPTTERRLRAAIKRARDGENVRRLDFGFGTVRVALEGSEVACTYTSPWGDVEYERIPKDAPLSTSVRCAFARFYTAVRDQLARIEAGELEDRSNLTAKHYFKRMLPTAEKTVKVGSLCGSYAYYSCSEIHGRIFHQISSMDRNVTVYGHHVHGFEPQALDRLWETFYTDFVNAMLDDSDSR